MIKDNLIHCPACNASHYQYHYSTTTAMGWIQEYKDGELVNGNPNISISYCTCCECGHNFYYEKQYGKVIKIIDQGKKPEVPTLNVPINAPSNGEVLKVKAENVLFMPSEKETTAAIPTDTDIKEVKDEIQELKKEISEIKYLIKRLMYYA